MSQVGVDLPSVHANKGVNFTRKCQVGQAIKIIRAENVQDRWRNRGANL